MFGSLLRLFGLGRTAPPPEAAGTDRAPAPAAPLFVPQNGLEEMLVAAAHDPQRRAAFNRLLLESTLYAASPDLPASRGMALPPAAGELRLIEVSMGGGPGLPALFRQFYGPTMNAFAAAEQGGHVDDLQRELAELFTRCNESKAGATSIPATFLRVTATKP